MHGKFYVREAQDYDVDKGLLDLTGEDSFEVKKNLQSTTSRFFYPKSFVFVIVRKSAETIHGVVTLVINKRLNGDKIGKISDMHVPEKEFIICRELAKYALDVALQDGCVDVDVVCDDVYVDVFRNIGFVASEKYHADLPL